MKYLGIDYGTKRVGIAVSDDEGKMAFPHSVVNHSPNLENDLAKIIEKEKIEAIVMGESKNFQMEENPIMSEIRSLAEKLKEKTNLSIHFHPEFLTSAEAERLQGKNDMLDASAAALILKSFLDTSR